MSRSSVGISLALALAFPVALALAFPLACSSSQADEPPFVDPMVAGRDQNPEGVAYPTDHLGGRARAGSQRGDRIPNFAFQGYAASNRAGGLKTISLADYYDPQQRHGKVLHLMEAAYWCTICDGQTREMTANKDALAASGVVIVQAIMNGAQAGTGPSLLEVGKWIDRYPTWFDVVVDDRAKRVGTVEDVAGVPWNALIDLRTMEILYEGVGRPMDYVQFTQAGLDWVEKHAPSY